jgi:hypothetical protein
MAKDFHEQYEQEEVGPPTERSTGFVFAAVALLVGVIFRENVVVLAASALLCAIFLGVSLLRPTLLGPLNIAWYRLSLLLHRIVNPIVLGLMFVFAILPFGLVMRIWRDPMRRKRSEGPTYWIEREPQAGKTHSMTNQF